MNWRENYVRLNEYLDYLDEVLGRSEATVKRNRLRLRHVLEWAKEISLSEAPDIRPVFPQYIKKTTRANSSSIPLSPAGIERTCQTARSFFGWLHQHHKRQYAALTPKWVETIQPPRMPSKLKAKREVVTLEMVRTLIALPDDGNLRLRRDKAAAAFLFLSGIRAGAFCTLPICCIDISARTVRQDPAMGVRTKNGKAAVTHLLDIPDLLAVVEEWDAYIRTQLPPSGLWYPVLAGSFGRLRIRDASAGKFRYETVRQNIRRLFKLAGLPPMSPHKFRHGHAVFGLTHSKNPADYKAVSMNLMHTNLGITDSIYAMLPEAEAGMRIGRLGTGTEQSNEDLIAQFQEFLAQRQST